MKFNIQNIWIFLFGPFLVVCVFFTTDDDKERGIFIKIILFPKNIFFLTITTFV